MHFWGGLLIGAGVHVLCSLKIVPLLPTTKLVIMTCFLATIGWELFEWYFKLYNPLTYRVDTTIDILLGFSGGLLAHFILKRLYNTPI
jgi:hypothetical protein